MKAQDQAHEVVLLTREVRARYKIGERAIRKLIRDGTFRAKLVGSGNSRKYLILASDVERWFRNDLPADEPVETASTPSFAIVPKIIPIASLPSLDADERAEINRARDSGELIERMIGGFPVLVSVDPEISQ